MMSMLGLVMTALLKGIAFVLLLGGGLLGVVAAIALALALALAALALAGALGLAGLALGILVLLFVAGVAVLPVLLPLLILYLLVRPRRYAPPRA